MARLKKSLLRVGKYQSPDGVVDVTPERLKHWADVFTRMNAAQLGIPVAWDHSDDPSKTIPVAFSTAKGKKRSAQHGVGWLESLKLTADGQAAELVLDIGDAKAAEKASDNLVEISPIIYPKWRDGSGREWQDCITHVDLVHHPVDAGQSPFIACSLRTGIDSGQPKHYRFADDENGGSFGEGKAGDNGEAKGEEENPDLPGPRTSDDEQRFEAIVAHLSEMGVVMPSDTDQKNFAERLLTALMTHKAAKDKAQAEAKENDDSKNEDDDMPAIEESPAFAAMSLQARTAHNYAENLHRQSLKQRLSSLLGSGRCSAAEHQTRAASLDSVKLSLDGNGTPTISQLEHWIDSREAIPQGAVWDPDQRLRMAHVEEPGIQTRMSSEPTEEEADKIADDVVFGRRNRQMAGAK